MAEALLPCLRKIDKTSSKYKYFPILENQVKIGRSEECTYTIISKAISRCHAIIDRKGDGAWTITDNKSLNGIAVNGKRLKALKPYKLQDGDIVQLSVAHGSFVYKFFSSQKGQREPKGSAGKRSHSENARPAKCFKGSREPTCTMTKSGQSTSARSRSGKGAEGTGGSLAADYEDRLSSLTKQLQEKEQEKSAISQQLQQEKQQRQAMEKEQKLKDHLQQEKDRLLKVIEMKEHELAESRAEREKAQADTLKAREAILSEFAGTMETELQCTICMELFVKATSLNCSHVFCALCIRQWLTVKKKCPYCQKLVTSQVHSVVLDSYISRMVEQFSDKMKQHRAELVKQRTEAEAKLDEAEKAGPSRSTADRGCRGRGQGRGQGRGRGRGQGRGQGRGRGKGQGRGQGRGGGRSQATRIAPVVAKTGTHRRRILDSSSDSEDTVSGITIDNSDTSLDGYSDTEDSCTESDVSTDNSESWPSSVSEQTDGSTYEESEEESEEEYDCEQEY